MAEWEEAALGFWVSLGGDLSNLQLEIQGKLRSEVIREIKLVSAH